MISDGLSEAPNRNGELFDYHRIQQVITDNGHFSSEKIKDELIKAVDVWLDGKHHPDDITIMVIKKC